jgi:hypothetical protein
MEVFMVLEEIYKEVHSKKGIKLKKLLCITIIEEDCFKISIKNRCWKNPVLIDIGSVIAPYVDEKTMEKIKETCKAIYQNKVNEIII